MITKLDTSRDRTLTVNGIRDLSDHHNNYKIITIIMIYNVLYNL